jgi:hypothetical protein
VDVAPRHMGGIKAAAHGRYFFRNASLPGALHFANFFVLMSRHLPAGAVTLHIEAATNLPASRHLPLASNAGAAEAAEAEKASTAAMVSVLSM